MTDKKKSKLQLTRRDFLGASAVLLSGSMVSRLNTTLEPLALAVQITPRRLYLAPDDHTDYFWTAGENEYRQAFLEMLDYYLDKADQTAGNPSDFQSRWNCDGSFWIWTYEKNRNSTQFQRLINRIKDGHISFPLNALVVCLGGAPAEAVLRGMYYAGSLERRYNLRVPIAIAMENQTLSYGLGALWAGAGARYTWKGVCGCDSQVSYSTLADRDYEIYWWVGPDGSRILTKWYSLTGGQSLGGYAEAYNPSAAVDALDSKCFSGPKYNYGIAGAFGQGWDNFKTMNQQCVTAAQSKSNANRRVIVSNQRDFFQDFETTYGASLPTLSCSFGNEWDLYCAALAEVSARVKRAVEKLRAAEALATLVSLKNPTFMNGRQAARDQAWMDLGLFWEHNFGMVGPPSGLTNQRVTWQKRLASEIESYVNTLHTDAINALGGMIRKRGTNLRFFAFNPLSWTRTDVVDLPYSQAGPVHVVELSTGQQTPSQLITSAGQQYLRVLAQNVPSIGYKVFEVRSGAGDSFGDGPNAEASTGVMQNDFYELTVAPRGAITSLKDRLRSNQEFANSVGGYVINDLGASSGSLAVENAGPVSVTLRATANSPLSHTTRITLFRSPINRIDIRNEITQNFDATHTWRFGFNLTAPDLWHEEVGAVIRARLLAQGGHYSPRNARYDWLTLNHFADMSGGGVGVTLSNADCYFMKLGNSTVSSLDTSTPQISALVGGRVANGGNGLPSQGGDSYFLQRFALKTHAAYDPVLAMKFALEHQNPLVAGVVTGGTAYPETSYSFLTISNPAVLLWALKPADDGIDQGIIARLWNLSTSPASFSLSLASGTILSAKQTTHVETPEASASLANGSLTGSLAAQQLKTFSLQVEAGTQPLRKAAAPPSGEQGAAITYTLSFTGTGNPLTLTDILPAGLGTPGNFELVGTSVSPTYDAGQRRLTWSDTPPIDQNVTIRYTVTITTADTLALVNSAELNEGDNLLGTASVVVIANPQLAYLPLVIKEN